MYWGIFLALIGCSEVRLHAFEDVENTEKESASVGDVAWSESTDDLTDTEEEAAAPTMNCISPVLVKTDGRAHQNFAIVEYPQGTLVESIDVDMTDWPEHSGAEFSDVDNLPTITYDMMGDYQLRVNGYSADGDLLDSCESNVQVRPSSGLWIEMLTDDFEDDLDLHLLSPDAWSTDAFTDADCYIENCLTSESNPLLNWGEPSASDDPLMILGNDGGPGPEIIRINSPQEGLYSVAIHDYAFAVVEEPTLAIVRVYIDGDVADERAVEITGEGDWLEVFYVDYVNGMVY